MKVRVWQIAKILNCDSKKLVSFINDLGINVRSYCSNVLESDAEIITHEYLSQNYQNIKDANYLELKKERLERLDKNGPSFIDYAIEALKKRIDSADPKDDSIEENEERQIAEIIISSWSDFNQKVKLLKYREWVFRGQSNKKWPLETSLFRAFNDARQLRRQNSQLAEKIAKNSYEQRLLENFKTNAHLFINDLPPHDDDLEWLAIMQHYGAPTRMLDFTYSPYVALFFSITNGSSDSTVYFFNKRGISGGRHKDDKNESLFKNQLLKEDSYLKIYEPKKTNQRLHSQQGLFVVPSNNYESIDEIIKNSDFEYLDSWYKYVIPKTLHYEMVENLKKMNITSSILFPGIEGYTQSLKYLLLEENEYLYKSTNS